MNRCCLEIIPVDMWRVLPSVGRTECQDIAVSAGPLRSRPHSGGAQCRPVMRTSWYTLTPVPVRAWFLILPCERDLQYRYPGLLVSSQGQHGQHRRVQRRCMQRNLHLSINLRPTLLYTFSATQVMVFEAAVVQSWVEGVL